MHDHLGPQRIDQGDAQIAATGMGDVEAEPGARRHAGEAVDDERLAKPFGGAVAGMAAGVLDT